MNRLTNILFAAILAILAISGLITYALQNPLPRTASVAAPNVATEAPPAQVEVATAAPAADRSASSLFTELLAPTAGSSAKSQSTGTDVIGITLRFALAALLAALLAFRPRRSVPVNRRNPYVAQTQILLAIVAAAMMIIVGDSAARAFGIFAAASLVSFRTNVRDPKEIAVLLVCLGVGLAMGVGRGDLAVALCLFVLVTLSVLEFLEPRQAFRSMQVCVETRDLDQTHEALRRIFAQQGFSTELSTLR